MGFRGWFVLSLVFVLAACGAPSLTPPQVETSLPPEPTEVPPSPPPSFNVPPGKALFVLRNFTETDLDIEIGSQSFYLPVYEAGKQVPELVLPLDPGHYTWWVRSPLFENRYINDPEGEKIFEFTVVEGDVYSAQALSLNPMTSTFKFVIESILYVRGTP